MDVTERKNGQYSVAKAFMRSVATELDRPLYASEERQ